MGSIFDQPTMIKKQELGVHRVWLFYFIQYVCSGRLVRSQVTSQRKKIMDNGRVTILKCISSSFFFCRCNLWNFQQPVIAKHDLMGRGRMYGVFAFRIIIIMNRLCFIKLWVYRCMHVWLAHCWSMIKTEKKNMKNS